MKKQEQTKTIKIRSAMPLYIMAAAFVLYGLLFPLYRLLHILLALAVACLIGLLSKIWFPTRTETVEIPPEPADTGDAETDKLLDEAVRLLRELENLSNTLRDAYMTREISRMETAGGLILDTLRKSPEKVVKVRRFLNYYLPTTLKLVSSYCELSGRAYQGENTRASLEAIRSGMDMIAAAFERQADNLFEAENLDITTDIEVLESVLKSEGLKSE